MRTKAQLSEDIDRYLSTSGDPEFRVQVFDRSRPTVSLRSVGYEDALRRTTAELLGSGGDRAEVYWGNTKVAEAYVQHRRVAGGGTKQSVKIVGEKLAKRPRRKP